MDSRTAPSKIRNLPAVFTAVFLTMNCPAASPAEGNSQTTSATSTKATAKSASSKDAPNAKGASGASSSAAPAQVLDASQFFGETQAAYEAAKECPELCANLFCYCGCDQTDHHSSLLDCFTTDHSADCQICRAEVFLALGMKKQGKTLSEIQSAIDEKYASEYPFTDPSPALKAYRAKRDGKPAPNSPDASNKKSEAKPKLKAGKKAGNCCGHKS
jgi:hypothetical protein